MSIRRLAIAALVILVLAALSGLALTQLSAPEPLRQVYTPTYRHVPPAPPVKITVAHLWRDLRTPAGQSFLRRLLPNQAGVLWLSLVVSLLVAFDFDDLASSRNLELLTMQALGFTFFEITRFLRLLHDPVYVSLMDWVFSTIFALNVLLVARALWRLRRRSLSVWNPVLGARALMTLASILLVCDVAVALVRQPDDVGFFVNLGAQRLRERRALPYGDPLLTGSPGAAYGPLLYVAHLPFQLALSPTPVNTESPDVPRLGKESTYLLPLPLATKLCTIAFHVVGVIALFAIGARLRTLAVGWALVALYAGSAYVLGVGGDEYFIGGMTYVSHIAPTAATLAAFALLPSPALAGIALAVAAGVGFYPAFMAPAWLGYFWDHRPKRWAFATGFLITVGLIGTFVLLMSHPAGGRGLIGTIAWDTFGHHTDPKHYGFSPFSFWGQRSGIRGWFNRPLADASNFTTPLFVTFVGIVIGSFWLTRRRAPSELALVTAVIAVAASLQKIHPTGTYVAWAYPFLLIGFFADSMSREAAPDQRALAEYVESRSASQQFSAAQTACPAEASEALNARRRTSASSQPQSVERTRLHRSP
jgi:hypothetical protein